MADSTENLNVTITADAGQATAGFNDVLAAAARLGGVMTETGEEGVRAGSAIAQAHAIAAGAAMKHAEEESILGASIGKVEIATNAAARAFSALGLQTGEATERVLGLTEALDALEASAGPIIVLGAAFLTLGAAVNFVREGIASAANEQREFTSIAVAVRGQGENWDEARESIEKFTTSLQAATTFSKSEGVAAIDSLTSSGIAYSDAEKIVAVATDVAAAKHVALITVTDAIREAEAGRGMGLVKLDANLKGLIETHARADVVIAKLAADTAGQATAAVNTYEGAQARLRNELELLGTEIGTVVLGPLEHATQAFIGITKAAESAGDAISKTINLIGDAIKVDADYVSGNSKLSEDSKSFIGSENKFGKVGADLGDATYDLFHPFNAGAPDTAAWMKERSKLNATPWERDPVIGRDPKPKKERASGDRAPVAFEDIGVDEASKTDAVVAAQKTLDEALKATTASEDRYKLAVELATTTDGKARAEAALRTKVAADASEASVRLGRQIAAERVEIAALATQQIAASASAERLRVAHNTLDEALTEHQDRSKAAAQRVAELKKQHDAAERSATTLGATIVTLTQQMSANSDALARQPALAESNAHAQAALILAYNTSRAAEGEKLAIQTATNGRSLEAELAYWQSRLAALRKGSADYLARRAEFENAIDETTAKIGERDTKGATEQADRAQKLADEETTYKASLAQQLAYYQSRYADTVTADGQYSTEARALADKIQSIELDDYKQRADEHAAFLKNFHDSENSIIDGVIEKHESMRDVLKNVWADMVKNFAHSLEEMIEKSSVLNGLNSKILSFFSPSNAAGTGGGDASANGAQGAAEGASSFGIFGALLGRGGASQVVSSLPTGAGATGLLVGTDAAQAAASTASSAIADPTAAQTGPSGGGGSFLGNAVGAVAEGGTIGGVAASLDGGNSSYGAIGGSLGGIIGLATHANPLIGAGIDAVTGLLGSLFTGGKPTKYKNPDSEDTQVYGQTIADLLGHAGANGQTFYEDSTTKSLFGGGTALAGLEQLAAGGQKAFTTSTGLGADVYKQLVSDVGSSTSGSGKLNFDKNIGSEYVTGAAGAGSTFRYTDIASLIAQIEKGLQNNGGSSSVPTFSVTRTYADPNQTGLVSDGSITPSKANLLSSSSGSPAVSVTINGNVVGPGGIATVANEIGIAINRVQTGRSPDVTPSRRFAFEAACDNAPRRSTAPASAHHATKGFINVNSLTNLSG